MNLKEKILNKLRPVSNITEFVLPYNHVELYYWKMNTGLNFGDHLSKVIVTKVLADNNHLLEEETSIQKRMLAVGSVLHFAKSGDTIWGSGVNGKVDVNLHTFKNLDVRAVRGPLTRKFLMDRGINVPEVYGDPALLLPVIFKGRFTPRSEKDFVVVPNLHDLEKAKTITAAENIISPLISWNQCIENILKAKFVISSSLHGLVIAEAYGIPARYIRLSETENLFKYNDYMMGSGRGEVKFATTIDEAMEMGGMPPIQHDAQKLLKAFPLDLWDI